MDVHQDLGQTSSEPGPISTYHDTEPVPISSYRDPDTVPVDNYEEKDDFWENGFNVEAANGEEDPTPVTKDDKNEDESIRNENGNGPLTPKKADLNELPPIHPFSSGQGLPYAPVDWPNAGDVWTWRVGRRVTASGFHHDRFIILPTSLQKPNVNKTFGSKPSLTRYIQKEFPNVDVNAFFDSFSWKIPAVFQPAAKVDAASLFEETPKKTQEQPENDENTQKDGKESTSRYSQRKRKQMQTYVTEQAEEKATARTNQKKKKEKPTTTPASAKPSSGQRSSQSSRRATRRPGGAVELSHLDEEEAETVNTVPRKKKKRGADLEEEQVSIPHIYVSPVNGVLAVSHSPVEVNPEEFDDYLNTLDNLLMEPPKESAEINSVLVNVSSPTREHEYTEARIKLTSLLEKDIPSLLFSSGDITELASLATKLRQDPSLSAEEVVKLKLLEETPSFSEVFRENKGVIEAADKFFSALELNKAKVASLKSEYSELKDKLSNLDKEVESNTETIRQIDEEIAQLQARRAELTRLIGNKNKEKVDLNYAQKMVANSIPKVVQEVQQANSKKPEWESKKESALKREGEILSKFSPLRGFYL